MKRSVIITMITLFVICLITGMVYSHPQVRGKDINTGRKVTIVDSLQVFWNVDGYEKINVEFIKTLGKTDSIWWIYPSFDNYIPSNILNDSVFQSGRIRYKDPASSDSSLVAKFSIPFETNKGKTFKIKFIPFSGYAPVADSQVIFWDVRVTPVK